MLKIGLLTIGNELTGGRIQDTNSALIARALDRLGWSVTVLMSVGDNEEAIGQALRFELQRVDAVIVTGGLGPTADDITTAVMARTFGLPLVTDETCLSHIRGLFERYRLPWTDNNAKQARFPQGAETLVNPVGTAWGFALRREGRIIIVIPGVPGEVMRMLPEKVIPLLQEAFPDAVRHVASRTIRLFGIPEASVDQALADMDFAGRDIAIGFYPRFPENQVVLTARRRTEAEARDALAPITAEVETRLREHIFAYDDENLEETVGMLLAERQWTLAVAESCTGGLITDRLTDVPGSSRYLERSVVTYSNAAKTDLLGVPGETLNRHGAVSEPTARLMAEGVRRLAGTRLGLAVTGIAGPTGGTPEKPAGTVYVALADGRETLCRAYAFRWDRRRNKIIAAQAALLLLQRYLKAGGSHGR